MEKGIVYYATADQYVKEANNSAENVKKHMPELSVTIFSHKEVESPYFDEVITVEEPEHVWLDRIRKLQQSPYEKTLYFDADIFLVEDVNEIFDMLERFDLAVAHAPLRHRNDDKYGEDVRKNVPNCFAEFNLGVLAYRTSDAVMDMLKDWENRYVSYLDDCKEEGQTYADLKYPEVMHDQPSFSEALYFSDLRVATLTPEYNCTFREIGYVQGKVRVLHGRIDEREEMARVINKEIEKRVYTGSGDRRVLSYPLPLSTQRYPGPSRFGSMLILLKDRIGEEGMLKTAKLLLERFKRLVR